MTTEAATGFRVPRTLDIARDWLASERHQAATAFALYAAISIGYFGLHVLPHLASATVGLPNWGDPTVNMWSLAWWPHALLHGLNPLVTDMDLTPDRINMAAVSPTLAPLAGIVAAPITLLFGPIVSYNVLMLAAPVLDAFFTFLLCRYITRSFAASLVGGYVFGFSTFILGHMLGHTQLVLIFPIPAAVELTLRMINGDIGQRRFIVLMALALAALYLIITELAATFVLLGAVALVVAFALARFKRAQIIRTVKAILAAGAIALLVTSPVIWYELHGTIHLGPGVGENNASDALGFLVPTNLTRLGRNYFAALATAYNISRSGSEATSYIGLGFALIVARYTITRWRLTSTKILFVMLAVVAVLVLGSSLHIAGYPTIPLPWRLIDHSLLQDVIPGRFSVYLFLIVGVIAAMWLAEPRSGKWAAGKWALAAASIALLVPNLGSGAWRGTEPNPAFFTTHDYRSVLKRGETVLVLPWGQLGYSMLWQRDRDVVPHGGRLLQCRVHAGLHQRPHVPHPFEQSCTGPPAVAVISSSPTCGRGDRRSHVLADLAWRARGPGTETHVHRRRPCLPRMTDSAVSLPPGADRGRGISLPPMRRRCNAWRDRIRPRSRHSAITISARNDD